MEGSDDRGERREQGIEFGAFEDDLESLDYPVSVEDLVESCGDRELGLPKGKTRLGDLLAPLEDETFDSPDAVRQMVFNMAGEDAVGRQEYSDRGDVAGDRRDEQQSL